MGKGQSLKDAKEIAQSGFHRNPTKRTPTVQLTDTLLGPPQQSTQRAAITGNGPFWHMGSGLTSGVVYFIQHQCTQTWKMKNCVFNTAASIPYNHDLCENLIGKRMKVGRKGTQCYLPTFTARCIHLQTPTRAIWKETNKNATGID
ncbi:hypothetical protein T265_04008 [Opisthorchis viverrini]|uniref:Uncharacterized protein n=1 Tax=Opisthorchis viverrini TaxID=6198 RepID=A0A074ZU39_OPIVI|nr:hypothetical protein T265_04008 [Opisthorchis viverrini]KER29347.1 hypothetical protein T265_04008 [Opisthorchis viverrini]